MYSRPTAPLPIGGVLDDAIKLYRESFARCWPIAVLSALVKGAFGIVLLVYMREAMAARSVTAMMQAYRQPPLMALYILYFVLSIALLGGLIASQYAVVRGAPISIGTALGVGFARLGRAVLAAIVTWVILVVGLILLLIPGIYAIGVLCLWPVALYGDDAGAMQALGVSRDLIKGHWWRTTTILTVSIIIILVFTFIVGLVTGIFSVFTHHDLMAAQLYGQLVGVVANVFALPAIPAVLVAIYNDLKLRREGGDLAARLGALPAS